MISRLALGAALVAGSAIAQGPRCETVDVTSPPPGMTGVQAEVCGANFGGGSSVVGYYATVSGFNFGNGTIASVSSSGYADIQYQFGSIKFSVIPQFAWGAWCAGLGTVIFEIKIP